MQASASYIDPLQTKRRHSLLAPLWRWLGWLLLATFALQLFFVARIALMARIDPESTTFQRSEFWRLAIDADDRQPLAWRQQWRPYAQISDHLKRAVIAAEDAGFARHHGVEWDAIRKAWQRNTSAERRAAARASAAGVEADDEADARPQNKKIYGGSTITQQLAKNLLLSGERSYLRKGQELLLSLLLESLLSKPRILEILSEQRRMGPRRVRRGSGRAPLLQERRTRSERA